MTRPQTAGSARIRTHILQKMYLMCQHYHQMEHHQRIQQHLTSSRLAPTPAHRSASTNCNSLRVIGKIVSEGGAHWGSGIRGGRKASGAYSGKIQVCTQVVWAGLQRPSMYVCVCVCAASATAVGCICWRSYSCRCAAAAAAAVAKAITGWRKVDIFASNEHVAKVDCNLKISHTLITCS